MNSLAAAIKTKGSVAGNFNTSINGRLYFVKAPQNPTYPFVIFRIIYHSEDYLFDAPSDSKQGIEDVLIQFNIHSNTKDSTSECGTILGYLQTQFDFAALTISGYNSPKMKRKRKYGPFWIQEDENWVYAQEYGLELQKS